VGQLPFNFQVGDAAKQIPLHAPQTPEGELEIRLDSCEGKRVAVLPLAPAASRPGVTTLPSVELELTAEHRARGATHDLCMRFTRRSIDPIWAIDSVQLVRR
jgi:hexosaminidase